MHSGFVSLTFVVGIVLTSAPALAQHAHDPAAPAPQHEHQPDGKMVPLFPARDASGTAWLPDTTPMYGLQRTWHGWELMLHGLAFAQFLYEPGDIHRTGGYSTHQIGSVNWAMLMARRPAGSGRVGVRAMLSGEPWTIPGCGYLNQLATGETCEGDTIHDRQHPHDLFMELAGEYDRPLRGSLRWQVYAGVAGEPALGPAAFPHRLSATPNPIAPISHHWLDATHITFGLVTRASTTAAGRPKCPPSMVANPTSIGPTWISVLSIPCPRASPFFRPPRSRSRCRPVTCAKRRPSFPRCREVT
jgi:hypothetical protein